MSIPTGIVTFLFTDIEYNTKFVQRLHNTHIFDLEKNNSILKEAVKSHNGFIFKTIGDAFCCAFENVNDSINASVKIQREIFKRDRSEHELKVRMGIHTGESEWTGDDYSGYLTLSRVQRIMSVAYGGQILISEDAYFEAIDHYKSEKIKNENEISFKNLGEVKLKDIVKPVSLYQVLSPCIPSEFVALATFETKRNNLPIQLTSFVGREKEIKEVKELLQNTHLLTLLGAAGTGKSRLSLQMGAELMDYFTNGVWLVELASLNDQSLVINEIASVLNLKEDADRKMSEVINDHLKDKELLLIFDNCEHLVLECAAISQRLIKSCPKLKILASSREALRISGEITYQVPTLSMPDVKKSFTPELLNQYEAVRLFIDRALAVKKDFEVNNKNAPAVAQLCYQLDGIPFAIELAAARINTLTVEKILDNINDRFKLLTRGSRTALPRQQTLRALIDWSYDLLSEDEKMLLQRLSIFIGGWSLDAADEVCSEEELDNFEVLDILSNLINKSLVISNNVNGKIRYTMLETIRQYGYEKLNLQSELHQKHFDYFLKFSTFEELKNKGMEEKHWLKGMESEQDNLRSAIKWSLENKPHLSLSLISEVGRYWELNGYFSEGLETYRKILEKNIDFDKKLKADAFMMCGYFAIYTGEYESAENYLSQSMEYYKVSKDKVDISECLNVFGILHFIKEEWDTAWKYYEESLTMARETDSRQTIANTLCNLGTIQLNQGEFDAAIKNFEEALLLYRENKNQNSIARILLNLGGAYYQNGDLAKAQKYLEEGLILTQEIGDHSAIAIALFNLGNLWYSQANYSDAEQMYEQALAISKEYGYSNILDRSFIKLGDIALIQNNASKAKEIYLECINILNKKSDKHKLALVFFGLANYYFNIKEFEMSSKFFGITESLYESIKYKLSRSRLDEFNNILNELKKISGEEKFSIHFNKGKSMSLEQGIELANSIIN